MPRFIDISIGPNTNSHKFAERQYGNMNDRAGRFRGVTDEGVEMSFDIIYTDSEWVADGSSNILAVVNTDVEGIEEGRLFYDTATQRGLLAPL